MLSAYQFLTSNWNSFTEAFGQHLSLVVYSLAISLVLGLPLGLWSARLPLVGAVVINICNSLRVVPSIAVLFLAIPYLGLGSRSAIMALIFLALPPVIVNTDVGFRTINPATRENTYAMGMSDRQVLQKIEIPLALPIVMVGIKTATTEVIASATLAAFVGAGGLGKFIVLGFAMYDNSIMLVGAIPVAIMALLAELTLGFWQNQLTTPPPLKLTKE